MMHIDYFCIGMQTVCAIMWLMILIQCWTAYTEKRTRTFENREFLPVMAILISIITMLVICAVDIVKAKAGFYVP